MVDKDSKFLCLVMAFWSYEFVSTTLHPLLSDPRLEIYVIENPSPEGSQLHEYLSQLAHEGKIQGLFSFSKNISNNAYEVVFEHLAERITASPFVVLTDGDLELPSGRSYQEQVEILESYPEIAVCGIQLDEGDLPSSTFPEAHTWIAPVLSEGETYREQASGIHMLVMRGKDLRDFLVVSRKKCWEFRDNIMHHWVYALSGRKWATTKQSVARHLTWVVYQDENHVYTRYKRSATFGSFWSHSRYCGYSLVTSRGTTNHFPAKARLRGIVRSLKKLIKRR